VRSEEAETMTRSSDVVLERAKVREVTGTFYSHAALENAAEALLLAGFDRADIDRIGSLQEMYKRLGAVEVAPEELPDVPDAPREPFIAREDLTTTVVAVVGTLAAFAAMIAALIVTASGGGTGFAIAAAVVAAIIAGGVGLVAVARLTGRERHKGLEKIEEAHGLILWVRVRSPDREDRAIRIMRDHGARAVRVHIVEIGKTVEDIPLSSLSPDPWLGPERLGQP
jgi:hypothetical protein